MNAPARRPATPYARRLARERGLALELISGSGPNGRIVAADVAAFSARREAMQPGAAASQMAVASAAFAAAVELTAALALIDELGRAGIAITLDDLLVRAAALALEAIPEARPQGAPIAVALETGTDAGRQLKPVTDPQKGRLGLLHDRLAAPPATPAEPSQILLSAYRIETPAICARTMPLLPGVPLRLVLSADRAAGEALLSFDTVRIGEAVAAALLGRVRDGLETPLRLLA